MDKTSYDFGQNYLTDYRRQLFASLLGNMASRPVHGLEVGCLEGRSLIWCAENICRHPGSTILGIDPSRNPACYARLLANVAQCPMANKITLRRESSFTAIPSLDSNHFDFAYIDGDHEGKSVLFDGLAAFDKLKPGGILIFDDYKWTNPIGWPCSILPKPGIDAFLNVCGPWLELLHKQYQVAIRRKLE